MSEEIKNIQLQFSCSANWNAMEEKDGDQYCSHCQKTVYDFTNSKVNEFRAILAENNYQVCGRFTHQQLHVQPVVLPFWRKWISAAMMLIGFHLFACNTNKPIGKIKIDKNTFVDDTHTIEAGTAPLNELLPTKKPIAKADNKIYENVEIMPEFAGGMDKFYSYISTHLHIKEDFSGRVIAGFVIEKNGRITNCEIINGAAIPSINEDVLRLLARSPKWKPGLQNGKKVRVRYRIPVIIN
ncbi:energy transducer TonB [Mucilaginibacter lacusdianchii]|uniref:energy transducer TonB n=1 Tax=Mucilaginibacter lacusdianchii TaxID=2684211 RepID=UPI00131BDA08|nr:energy transducer TonB [Mucilaginibacter sp. JXJ CY 39]